MKKIQKILLMVITLLMAGLQTSCTDYQDEIDALDVRVTVLENLVKQLNLDLSSMRTIVEVIENGDYITNVTENAEGYIITFGKHGAIVIKNGIDGKNGKDAEAPNISVAKDADGIWYWTLNGEWILGPDGNKVRADGKDGKDGVDGKDGTNGKDGKDGTNGKDGNPFFESVTYEVTADGEFMVIVTKGGQTFKIPIYKNS